MAVQSVSLPPTLARVISAAGDKSGVDFDYLVQTAVRESSLNPEAKASTSSAVGLFQFIESTWLEVLKLDGPRLGYGEQARFIERNSDGDFVIRDAGKRREILALREDPQMSADLAAAFTKRNGDYLFEQFGRMPSPGELYIAHFLGARGAEELFQAGLSDPNQIAANLFPRQARANRSIFYDTGGAKTVREVYESLVSKHASELRIAGDNSTQPPAAQSRYAPVTTVSVDFTALYASPQTLQTDARPSVQTVQTTQGGQGVIVDPGGTLFVQLFSR